MAEHIPGWRHLSSGKVRDLYVPDHAREQLPGDGPGPAASAAEDVVLMVASDRISAYDHVLPTPIPDKGAVLTRLSRWWFEELADLVPNHLVPGAEPPAQVADRAMVCARLDMFPVECVARGYLTGSGLADYRARGAVGGNPLPAGLVDGDRIEPPIYTPAAKADVGGHDENIDLAATERLVGASVARRLRDLTLQVYSRAEAIARERGIILADTKLEFGLRSAPGAGGIALGDEVLTPDSSRFWDAAQYRPGRPQPSFDKQYVRDWLTSPASGWDRHGDEAPPELPGEVVEATRARYLEAFERLTGTAF